MIRLLPLVLLLVLPSAKGTTLVFKPANAPLDAGENIYAASGATSPELVPFTDQSAAGVNGYSGGMAVFSTAWLGGASALAWHQVTFNVPRPASVKATIEMTYLGGTMNYGFASFSGSSVFWQLDQGDLHDLWLDFPFSFEVISGKVIDLIFLAAGGLLPEGKIAEMVSAMEEVYTYASLFNALQDLAEAQDAKKITKTVNFTADEGAHSLNVGLTGTASAFVTGSAFAVLCGQLDKVTLEINTLSDLPPDLVISDLYLEEPAVRGEVSHIRISRCNIGGQSTSAENYSLKIQGPDSPVWNVVASNLFNYSEFPPGTTRTVRYPRTFNHKGAYQLVAWADEALVVPEIDDWNNACLRTIQVKGRPPFQPALPGVTGFPLPYGVHLHRNHTYTLYTSGSDPDQDTLYYQYEIRPGDSALWQPWTNQLTAVSNGWSLSPHILLTPMIADADMLPTNQTDPRTWLVMATNHFSICAKTADPDGESPRSLTNGFTVILNELPSTPVISGDNAGTTLSGVTITAQTTDDEEDPVAFRFDWGDRSMPTWTDWQWCPKGQTNVTVSHLYAQAGLYCVTVQATDAYSHRYEAPLKTSGAATHWVNIRTYVPKTNALTISTVDVNRNSPLPQVNLQILGTNAAGSNAISALTGAQGVYEYPAMPGTYTVVFQEVPGMVTPSSQTKTLPTNGIIQFTGGYTHKTGTLRVNCNVSGQGYIVGQGTAAGDNHRFSGAGWVNAAAWEGDHAVWFESVDDSRYGLPQPRHEIQHLSAGNTVVFAGRYIERPQASLSLAYPAQAAFYTPSNAFVLANEDIVSLDGTRSHSPSQPRGASPPYPFPDLPLSIAAYQFAFDEGRVYREDAATLGDGLFDGKTIHVFHQTGKRRVALTVEDSSGCASKNAAVVEVWVKERPQARITIDPAPSIAGETAQFLGQGWDTDPGDTTVDYAWSASWSDSLPATATFYLPALSWGTKTISLRVRGSDNVWSKPVSNNWEIARAKEWPAFKQNERRWSAQSTYEGRNSGLLPYGPASGFWPFAADSPIEGSPVAANMDGDWANGLEIAVVSRLGSLYVLRNSSSLWWSNNIGASSSTPAMGDINNDGHLEIVVGSQNGIMAFDRFGSNLFHHTASSSFQYSMPVLADIDPDQPGLEVAVTGDDGSVHVLHGDGTSVAPGWPFNPGGTVSGTPDFPSAPAVADIDGGHLGMEIVVGGLDGSLYVLDRFGVVLASNAIPGKAAIRTSPAIADLCPAITGLEIVFGADDGVCYCHNYLGGTLNPVWQYVVSPRAMIRSSPAIGVVGEEPGPQVIFGCDNGHVYLLMGTNGQRLGDYLCGTAVMVRSTPALANIDSIHNFHPVMGDLPEVIVGASDGRLHAISFAWGGSPVPFWPLVLAASLPIHSSPAVADIDHDPDLEILVGAQDRNLYLLRATPNPALAPTANFGASPVTGSRPLTVLFSDLSVNVPTAWAWSFGDGNYSSQPNPDHLYATPGVYTVTLSVANVHGKSALTKTNCLTVNPCPLADFTANPLRGKSPLTVQFTDRSLYAPAGWQWSFGDGTSSTQPNPSYTYSAPGLYGITLWVSNTHGLDVLIQSNYILVEAVCPRADFRADALYGAEPLTVQFLDLSTNAPASWTWNFGDGATSQQPNPAHTYSLAGRYLVSLTVSNAAGADTKTSATYVSVLRKSTPASLRLLDLSLNEGSGGIAHDATTNQNHGNIQGAVWTTGHEGMGLRFQGGGQWNDGDAIVIPHAPSLILTNAFSVETWIQATGLDHYMAIADKYSGEAVHPSDGFTLYLTGGRLRFSLYSRIHGSADCWGTSELRDDTWHHVKGVWNGDSIQVFVDDQQEGESPWAYPPGETDQPLGIGKRLSGWGGYLPFQGLIDEVLLSNLVAPEPSFLSWERKENRLLLFWNTLGTLQTSPGCSGDWQDLETLVLPHVLSPDAPAAFYRLRLSD